MESQSAAPTPAETIRSLSIDGGRHRLLGRLHTATGDPAPTAVLICPPWGPDEPASYRPRRAWGLRLAEAGYPTLRFDLPGTGDSAGVPDDPGLVDAWLDAISAAANRLRRETGAGRVVALGLGLGGLLAIEAVDRGAPIDDVATWAAPANGRAFIREMRNFSRLEDWNAGDDGAGAGDLPTGWFEVDGFAIAPATVRELEALKVGSQSRVPRRTLLIGRNTGQAPQAVGDRLGELGSEVTLDTGGRWGSFVVHPESARLPDQIAAALEAWLAEAPAADEEEEPAAEAVASPVRREAGGEEIRLGEGGEAIRETAFTLPLRFGELFGILAEPLENPPGDLCAVLLNSGAQRHSGPNRMWTERARAWAARGIPTLRLDLQEIGESGGDPDGMPPGDMYFSPRFGPQVTAALDELAARGLGRRFLLLGLCSGAYHSFRQAVADERVVGAYLINPTVLVWRPGIFEERELRMNVQFLGEGDRLRKFLRGEIGRERIKEYLVTVADGGRQAAGRMIARRGRRLPDWQDRLLAELDQLAGRRVSLLIAFSGEEWLADEFKEVGFVPKLKQQPNVKLEDLPGSDHSLRPIAAQRRFAEVVDSALTDLLGEDGAREESDERMEVGR